MRLGFVVREMEQGSCLKLLDRISYMSLRSHDLSAVKSSSCASVFSQSCYMHTGHGDFLVQTQPSMHASHTQQ